MPNLSINKLVLSFHENNPSYTSKMGSVGRSEYTVDFFSRRSLHLFRMIIFVFIGFKYTMSPKVVKFNYRYP